MNYFEAQKKAKDLGIKGYISMKKDVLFAKIEEAEKALSNPEPQNSEITSGIRVKFFPKGKDKNGYIEVELIKKTDKMAIISLEGKACKVMLRFIDFISSEKVETKLLEASYSELNPERKVIDINKVIEIKANTGSYPRSSNGIKI